MAIRMLVHILMCVFLVSFPNTLSIRQDTCRFESSGSVTFICVEKHLTAFYSNDSAGLYIICNNNKSPLPNIHNVNFENCQMSEIPQDLFNVYVKVSDINFSGTGLERLHKEVFDKVDQLHKFNASHNNITEVPAFLFLHAESLQEVDLSHNKIKQLDLFSLFGVKVEVSSQISFNPYEVNIQGVRCIPMIDEISNNGNIMNQSEAIAIATTEPTVNNDVKMVHENTTNINLEEIEKKQTTALSALAQAQNDLHTMKILQIFMSAMLASIFIVILILVIVNRINLINIPRYRDLIGQSERQSSLCINNSVEVTTFSQ